jgi:hypothetical protein
MRLCGVQSKQSMRWRSAEAQATVLLNDGFAVLDCERPDVDSKLGDNDSDWIDVNGDRIRQTSRASACRALHQRPLGQIRLVFAISSTPGSTTARLAASTARGASRSFCSGPRRPPLARVTQAERRELRLAVSSR